MRITPKQHSGGVLFRITLAIALLVTTVLFSQTHQGGGGSGNANATNGTFQGGTFTGTTNINGKFFNATKYGATNETDGKLSANLLGGANVILQTNAGGSITIIATAGGGATNGIQTVGGSGTNNFFYNPTINGGSTTHQTNLDATVNFVIVSSSVGVLTNHPVVTTQLLTDVNQVNTNLYTISNSVTSMLLGRTGTTLVIANTNSTFSGWASCLGTPQAFDQLQFIVYPWTVGSLPTAIRIKLRRLGFNGEILADSGVVTASFTAGTTNNVTWNIGSTIWNAPGEQLWLEYDTNGKVGNVQVNPSLVFPTYPHGRYDTSASTSPAPGSFIQSSVQFTLYAAWLRTVTNVANLATTAVWSNLFSGQLALSAGVTNLSWPQVSAYLPLTNYALATREFQMCLDNVVSSTLPNDQLDYRLTCSKGTLLGRGTSNRKYKLTAAQSDAGIYPFTFDAYWRNMLLCERSVYLKVVSTNAGSGTTRKLLMVGDSWTSGGSYLTQLTNLSGLYGFHLNLVGTQGSTGMKNEGYSGRYYQWFYTNSASPFVFSGSFNFATYLANNSITLSTSDWVVFALGINDVFGEATDALAISDAASSLAAIDAMATNIKAAVPGIRIAITMIPPFNASQDAFAVAYGVNGAYTQPRQNRNRLLFLDRFMQEHDEPDYLLASAPLVPWAYAVDAVNDFPVQASTINSNNFSLYNQSSNAVHPDTSGYYNAAESLYAYLIGHEP